MLLPSASGFSPHPPVSVYGTGGHGAIAAFLGTKPARFPTLFRSASRLRLWTAVFLSARLLRLHRFSLSRHALRFVRPRSSGHAQYRNFCLLSIGYGLLPRLRPRLTQGRSALPWKPWISGRKDSCLPPATHSGILSSRRSTALTVQLRRAGNAPLPRCQKAASQASAACFSPGHFRRRTSRLVSCYALF